MSGSVILDIVLVIVLVSYLGYGWTTGFLRGLGSLVGIIVGAGAALIAIPLITTWIPVQGLRVVAVVLVALTLIGLGQYLGILLAKLLSAPLHRDSEHRNPLGVLDRALGAVATVLVTALVLSLVATGVSGLGMPAISRMIGSSAVIRTIDSLTPDPVQAFMARAQGALFDTSFTVVSRALGLDAANTELPEVDTSTPQLVAASASVVRITGTAYSCGQYQSGSGFVIARNRVLTNAHVVAGVAEPVVETRAGQSLPGRVVYLDPLADLAVLAVPELDTSAVSFGDTLEADELAVTAGYPWGGPFVAHGASVIDVSVLPIADIYGESSPPRSVYTLAATVNEGDSGGPLLSLDGRVVGAIFARGPSDTSVGFAVTMDELEPVVSIASSLTGRVDSGICVASASASAGAGAGAGATNTGSTTNTSGARDSVSP